MALTLALNVEQHMIIGVEGADVTVRDDAGPVVVGVDGSAASVEAATWAVDEAIDREVPLRLVSVTNILPARVIGSVKCVELEHAEFALKNASSAIEATGKTVQLETEVLWGPPSNALIAESHHSSMVCVASVGIGVVARAILGSTAAAVAERAHCTAAVLRPSRDTAVDPGAWVAVGIGESESRSGEQTAAFALHEARLRRAALIVVGLGCNAFGVNTTQRHHRRAQAYVDDNPDVTIEVDTTRFGLADYLADRHARLSHRHPSTEARPGRPLAVLGSEDIAQLPSLIGPHGGGILEHAKCSVVVVR